MSFIRYPDTELWSAELCYYWMCELDYDWILICSKSLQRATLHWVWHGRSHMWYDILIYSITNHILVCMRIKVLPKREINRIIFNNLATSLTLWYTNFITCSIIYLNLFYYKCVFVWDESTAKNWNQSYQFQQFTNFFNFMIYTKFITCGMIP